MQVHGKRNPQGLQKINVLSGDQNMIQGTHNLENLVCNYQENAIPLVIDRFETHKNLKDRLSKGKAVVKKVTSDLKKEESLLTEARNQQVRIFFGACS